MSGMVLGIGIGIKYDTSRIGKISVPAPPQQVSVFASGEWNNGGTWNNSDTWKMEKTVVATTASKSTRASTKKKATKTTDKSYWNF